MKIDRSSRGRNKKRSWLDVLGILAMLLSLLFNPGTSHAQAGASGTVFAWGRNSEGQTNVPAELSGVAAVAAGHYHSLALMSDGTVVGWGSNIFDQVAIPAGLSGVTAVAAGQYHSLALKNDGTVVAWGRNIEGQANIPAGLSDVTAITAGCEQSLALKNDGTVVAWGGNSLGQATIPAGLSDVAAVSAGCDHNLALKSDGTVVSWGHNSHGQTSVPAGLSGVAAVSAGYYYSLALKSDGTVVGWGNNGEGQASIPAGLSGVTAISAGGWHSLALKSDGTVVGWGWNGHGQTSVPAGLSGVTAIRAGAMHSLALVQPVPAGHHPVALDDSYSTDGNTALTVAAPGVLSNDTDEDGDPLSANLVSGPAHGTLTLNADGSFNYLPATNYAGADSFTYRAFDGELSSDIATVSITVSQTNNAPVAIDQSVATPRNTPLAITLTATDVENSALTYTIVTGPTHGTLSGTAPNLTYTPNKDYAGDDFLYFKANDGELDSNVAQIAISVTIVRHHPVALDDSYSTNVNTALKVAAPGVLSNDTDEDGDMLYVHHVSGPDHGTLTLNVDGSFNYMPATNYAGQDSFIYRAVDGELASNYTTVSITVSQTNHAPVAIDDSYKVIANTILTVAAPGVLRNDTDADGDRLTAALVSGPAHGALRLNTGGSFAYIPARNYAGPDSFTYKVNDGQAGSNIATVSIAIQYRFTGFFQPVDNPGPGPRYVFNIVKAGSAVPVKFSLAGYQGLSIFSPGYPASTPVKCTTAARFDPIEQTVTAGNSSLSYNPASGIYTYAWKTEKKWAGTCRLLTVQLKDGTQHLAYFLFK